MDHGGGFLVTLLSVSSVVWQEVISVATAAIAITTREKRSKGMAFVGIAFGLGFVLGPALGGLLLSGTGRIQNLFFLGCNFCTATISFTGINQPSMVVSWIY